MIVSAILRSDYRQFHAQFFCKFVINYFHTFIMSTEFHTFISNILIERDRYNLVEEHLRKG